MVSHGESDILKRVRKICLALSEAVEHINGFGHTTFQVNKKSFVLLSEQAGLAFKSNQETQGLLLQQEKFFKIGRHGWVSILNPFEEDWSELTELIQESYLRKAQNIWQRNGWNYTKEFETKIGCDLPQTVAIV